MAPGPTPELLVAGSIALDSLLGGQITDELGGSALYFALAASLAEEIHRPWATALLYAGAGGTAWSRLNDHKHWLSDVLAGATVGITAAKVITGRWRIFGLGAPRFLHAGLEWRLTF